MMSFGTIMIIAFISSVWCVLGCNFILRPHFGLPPPRSWKAVLLLTLAAGPFGFLLGLIYASLVYGEPVSIQDPNQPGLKGWFYR